MAHRRQLPLANNDSMQWRANIVSSGRALLMLFLFSDVGPDDAVPFVSCLVHAAQPHRGARLASWPSRPATGVDSPRP